MIWVVDGINYGVGWCFSGWLVIALDGDADLITLGVYEGIDIGFSYICF